MSCLFSFLRILPTPPALSKLRIESRWFIYAGGLFFATLFGGACYGGYKIWRFYDPTQVGKYVGTGSLLTYLDALFLLLVAANFVAAGICYRNFGRGLKNHCIIFCFILFLVLVFFGCLMDDFAPCSSNDDGTKRGGGPIWTRSCSKEAVFRPLQRELS